MSDDDLTPDQIAAITAYVDIEAPPPDEPTAHIIFGTNQAQPAAIVAGRYRRRAGAPDNRHRRDQPSQRRRRGPDVPPAPQASGVPDGSIRVEDQSANTWQNVELALPFLREALASGLRLTAVSKWYHRRAVHALRTLLPEAEFFYAISWEPVYAGALVTRDNWPKSPDGRRRVIREWQEVPAGSAMAATAKP